METQYRLLVFTRRINISGFLRCRSSFIHSINSSTRDLSHPLRLTWKLPQLADPGNGTKTSVSGFWKLASFRLAWIFGGYSSLPSRMGQKNHKLVVRRTKRKWQPNPKSWMEPWISTIPPALITFLRDLKCKNLGISTPKMRPLDWHSKGQFKGLEVRRSYFPFKHPTGSTIWLPLFFCGG